MVLVGTVTVTGRGTLVVDGQREGGDFYLAKSDALELATSGDFFMATRTPLQSCIASITGPTISVRSIDSNPNRERWSAVSMVTQNASVLPASARLVKGCFDERRADAKSTLSFLDGQGAQQGVSAMTLDADAANHPAGDRRVD